MADSQNLFRVSAVRICQSQGMRETKKSGRFFFFFCKEERRVIWSGGVRFVMSYGKDFLRKVGPTQHSLMRCVCKNYRSTMALYSLVHE